MSYWRGLPNDGWDMRRLRMGITTVPIATQLAHAVGYLYVTNMRPVGHRHRRLLRRRCHLGNRLPLRDEFRRGMEGPGDIHLLEQSLR